MGHLRRAISKEVDTAHGGGGLSVVIPAPDVRPEDRAWTSTGDILTREKECPIYDNAPLKQMSQPITETERPHTALEAEVQAPE